MIKLIPSSDDSWPRLHRATRAPGFAQPSTCVYMYIYIYIYMYIHIEREREREREM